MWYSYQSTYTCETPGSWTVEVKPLTVEWEARPTRVSDAELAELDREWRELGERNVLRTYELAPATPWYVWASVALAFMFLMAWWVIGAN